MAYRYTVLFELAWTDFETAHYLFHSRTHPPLNQICFMSHQAVEKGLKSLVNPTELQMLLSSWREERQQKLREGKR